MALTIMRSSSKTRSILLCFAMVACAYSVLASPALAQGRVQIVTTTTDLRSLVEAVGAPDTIRTCGLRLRRATLYPAELRVLTAYAVLTRISRMSEPQREVLASHCVRIYDAQTRTREEVELT